MTEFTTSKGEFIAVPVPDKAHTFTNDLVSHQIDFILDTIFLEGTIGFSACVILSDYCGQSFEIIGLSSDILKDEELASIKCVNVVIGHWKYMNLSFCAPSTT